MPRYFASKYRRDKKLRTGDAEVFYNPTVTDDDLWKMVGRLLQRTREDKGWRTPTDVYSHGGPHNNIVTRHEHGKMSSVKSLAKHAQALDISVTDLFRTALDQAKPVLSPQARRIAQRFDGLDASDRALALAWFARLQRRVPKRPTSQ